MSASGRLAGGGTAAVSSKHAAEPRRVYLSRGPAGFGFRLSTNHHKLQQGYNHFASTVDDGGQAQLAGLRLGDRIIEIDGQLVTHWPHA